MNINVVKQNDNEVCVDVSAYLLPKSVKEVFDDVLLPENETANLEVEEGNIEENVSITIPPKPQININEQIAYNTPKTPEDSEFIREEQYEVPQQEKNKKDIFFFTCCIIYILVKGMIF